RYYFFGTTKLRPVAPWATTCRTGTRIDPRATESRPGLCSTRFQRDRARHQPRHRAGDRARTSADLAGGTFTRQRVAAEHSVGDCEPADRRAVGARRRDGAAAAGPAAHDGRAE